MILLRFGALGSTEPTGLEYCQIARKLPVTRESARQVCVRYLRRGGRLLLKMNQDQRAAQLNAEQRGWLTKASTLRDWAELTLPLLELRPLAPSG